MKTGGVIARDIHDPAIRATSPCLPGRLRLHGFWRSRAGVACIWAATCAVLVTGAIAFVDRPVARLMHDTFRHGPAAMALARLPETSSLVPFLIVVVAAACLIGGMGVGAVLRTGGLALASFLTAETIKGFLKIAFGRTWPETWVGDNVSFIRDGVFGFFPFHGGPGYASFPSGHMTAAASVMTVAWCLLPRGRALWAMVMAAAAAGLLAMNYHYVSDVIAGFFLGSGVAVVVVGGARWLRVVAPTAAAPRVTAQDRRR